MQRRIDRGGCRFGGGRGLGCRFGRGGGGGAVRRLGARSGVRCGLRRRSGIRPGSGRDVDLWFGFGVRVGVEGRTVGDDVHDDAGGAGVGNSGGQAFGPAALATQVKCPREHGAESVGAFLGQSSRVVGAHTVDHGLEPSGGDGRINGVDAPEHAGGAGRVVTAPDAEVPVAVLIACTANRIGIQGVQPHCDRGIEFVTGQHAPRGSGLSELFVQPGPHLIVDDQPAQPDDAGHHPLAHLAGKEPGVEAGQLVAQQNSGVHQGERPAVGDAERARHLCGRVIDRVAGPPPALRVRGSGAALPFGQRRELAGFRRCRGTRPAGDRVDQLPVGGLRQRGRTSERTVEHMSESMWVANTAKPPNRGPGRSCG